MTKKEKAAKDYCVYDTETTGFTPHDCDVIELAAKRYKGGVVEAKSWLIKPGGFSIVPANITEITGITTKEILEKGMDEKKAWTEFVEFAGDLPLVGHNIVKFDNPFVMKYVKRHELTKPKGLDKYADTAAIFKARQILAKRFNGESIKDFYNRVLETRIRGLKFNLAYACKSEGIDVSDLTAHRADADVEMTDRLFRKLCI